MYHTTSRRLLSPGGAQPLEFHVPGKRQRADAALQDLGILAVVALRATVRPDQAALVAQLRVVADLVAPPVQQVRRRDPAAFLHAFPPFQDGIDQVFIKFHGHSEVSVPVYQLMLPDLLYLQRHASISLPSV